MQTETRNLDQIRDRLTPEVLQAIRDVLDHLAIGDVLDHFTVDELMHYRESTANEQEDHIFRSFATVDAWLSGEQRSADDLVEQRRTTIPNYHPAPGCCGRCDDADVDRVDRRTYLVGQALAGLLARSDTTRLAGAAAAAIDLAGEILDDLDD